MWAGEQVEDAQVCIEGKWYTRQEGESYISVPFKSYGNTTRTQVILSSKAHKLAVLANFEHESETYSFDPGIYVDREALVAGASADLIIRARSDLLSQ